MLYSATTGRQTVCVLLLTPKTLRGSLPISEPRARRVLWLIPQTYTDRNLFVIKQFHNCTIPPCHQRSNHTAEKKLKPISVRVVRIVRCSLDPTRQNTISKSLSRYAHNNNNKFFEIGLLLSILVSSALVLCGVGCSNGCGFTTHARILTNCNDLWEQIDKGQHGGALLSVLFCLSVYVSF